MSCRDCTDMSSALCIYIFDAIPSPWLYQWIILNLYPYLKTKYFMSPCHVRTLFMCHVNLVSIFDIAIFLKGWKRHLHTGLQPQCVKFWVGLNIPHQSCCFSCKHNFILRDTVPKGCKMHWQTPNWLEIGNIINHTSRKLYRLLYIHTF